MIKWFACKTAFYTPTVHGVFSLPNIKTTVHDYSRENSLYRTSNRPS